MNKAERSRAAAILGSRGGKARMANLTKEERSELGRAAVRSRWDKVNQNRVTDNGPPPLTEENVRAAFVSLKERFLELHGASAVVQAVEGPPPEVILSKVPAVVPRSAADRLAAGLCRGCGAPRVQMSNGKLNAQWCHDCREKQRAYDAASWRRRHGTA